MTLYSLTSQQLAFLESMDGELDAITEAALLELADATAEKLDAYLAVRATKEMYAAQARKEAAEWKAKADRLEAEIERLDGALRLHLERTGQTKAMTAKGRTISLQSNGGLVPLVFETGADPSAAALEFVKTQTVYSWDRDKIREALASGPLPFARLGERGKRVVIR